MKIKTFLALSVIFAAAAGASFAQTVTTLSGRDHIPFADGQGTEAIFFSPPGVAVDGSGNVYVADSGNNRIRKITAGGLVTTLAGGGGGHSLGRHS